MDLRKMVSYLHWYNNGFNDKGIMPSYLLFSISHHFIVIIM